MSSTLKIVTFVPVTHADAVRQAMGDAGAGVIGNYHYCTWSTKGIGRFVPIGGSNPYLGSLGKLEEVDEERIETVCDEEKLEAVKAAINEASPYEETPIDVYPILPK